MPLAALLVLAGLGLAHASGYHPDFDEAVEQADWIVLGQAVHAAPAGSVLTGIPADQRQGEVYRVPLSQSFTEEGPGAAELYAWDPYAGSTAGYYLSTEQANLSFLVVEPGIVASDGLPVGRVIRNLSDTASRGRGAGRDDWVTLLSWTDVGRRPLSVAHAREALGDPAAGRNLLNYVLEHWPGTLTDADADAVSALLETRASDAYVTRPATRLLRAQGRPLTGQALHEALRTGSPHARSELVKDVDDTNVEGVRELLWGWLATDAEGALYGLEALATHDPGYLRAQLEAQSLPFWLDIPAIRALDLQPRDLGRDYPVTTDNPWRLVDLGKLVKGEDFGVRFAMAHDSEELDVLLPLLVPHLPAMTDDAREVGVAALRTAGFTVQRQGDGATLGPRDGAPLVLQVEPLSADRVRLVVRATRPTMVCDQVQVGIELASAEGTVSRSAMHGDFGPAPRDCFALRDDLVLTREESLSSLSSLRPEPATVRAELLFAHPGTEHGLDAWTGMVSSEAVPLP